MSINASSEQNHYRDYCIHGARDARELYLAGIALANTGASLREEEALSQTERELLEVRRKLYQLNFSEAENILKHIKTGDTLLKGDQHFLWGQLFHRSGHQEKANHYLKMAADFYRDAGEKHRELRARSNAAICVATLQSCLLGELHVYLQEARKLNFSDIAANIIRTLAIELILAEKPHEAVPHALESAALYELDGYLEDQSVAYVLAAIAQLLTLNPARALETISRATIKEGKVQSYHEAFQTLLHGKIPKLHAGHPLARTNWKIFILKPESVPGKVLKHLQQGSQNRDKLVALVWGDLACGPAYYDRLYTAINFLRKEKNLAITFDGEFYRLG